MNRKSEHGSGPLSLPAQANRQGTPLRRRFRPPSPLHLAPDPLTWPCLPHPQIGHPAHGARASWCQRGQRVSTKCAPLRSALLHRLAFEGIQPRARTLISTWPKLPSARARPMAVGHWHRPCAPLHRSTPSVRRVSVCAFAVTVSCGLPRVSIVAEITSARSRC